MNSGHSYAALLIGSNFQRSKNFKKGLLLLESSYKILKRSRIYKSDDILQKGKFYWNLGVLIELHEISLLKNDMLKIEKECKRRKGTLKQIITIDIDVVLVYKRSCSAGNYKLIMKNIEDSLYSSLILKEIVPKSLLSDNFPEQKSTASSIIKKRNLNFMPITEISSPYDKIP